MEKTEKDKKNKFWIDEVPVNMDKFTWFDDTVAFPEKAFGSVIYGQMKPAKFEYVKFKPEDFGKPEAFGKQAPINVGTFTIGEDGQLQKKKWIPRMKDGKLLADGDIARRKDSELPEELIQFVAPAKIPETKPQVGTKAFPKKSKPSDAGLVNPKNNLNVVVMGLMAAAAAYKKLVEHAKIAQWGMEEFENKLKNLSQSYHESSMPFHVVSAMEKSAVKEYIDYISVPKGKLTHIEETK